MSRVLAAAVLLPPLVAILVYAPAWAFLLVVEAAALRAVWEFYALFSAHHRPFRVLGALGTAAFVASFYPPAVPVLWVAVGLILAAGIAAVRRAAIGPATPGDVALTVLGAGYAGLLLGSLVGLRLVPPDAAGRSWLIFLLAVVFFGDSGAYYAGKSLGRRPLAPRISPKKTWAGLYGGTAASLLAAIVFGWFLLPELPLARAAALGVGLSLLGVAGDLFESLLKRSVAVKDSSALIPGHGGMLDRLDSLLFSAPALLAYLRLAPPS